MKTSCIKILKLSKTKTHYHLNIIWRVNVNTSTPYSSVHDVHCSICTSNCT